MNKKKTNWILTTLIILLIIIINLPNIFYKIPVGQTDMAHFYGISKNLKTEKCINCPLEDYSQIYIPEVNKIKDYPILFTALFAFLSYFIPDILLLNGLYI